MIKILAKTKEELLTNLTIDELQAHPSIDWYWMDFYNPTEQEQQALEEKFDFHPLAVEDCLNQGQRAKFEIYDEHYFLVYYALHKEELENLEVSAFIGDNFVVTYHVDKLKSVARVTNLVEKDPNVVENDPWEIIYELLDHTVDEYFPTLYRLEDQIDDIEDNAKNETMDELMRNLYDIRSDLSRMRRILNPMRDLIYRIMSTNALKEKEQVRYFNDIYDHLLNMIEIMNASRDLSNDIRESFMSINSDRMNSIMFTLTLMSAIFLPLTFIAGLYGMNFSYMPELAGKYNYFIVLGIMVGLVGVMVFAFYKMGWFKYRKGPKL
ncbi:magnesium and cobalt transport protein CorA [Priestia aryabhattai]|nr:magnesium and cobalt transport protein CorA [Priestia aryabhattai]